MFSLFFIYLSYFHFTERAKLELTIALTFTLRNREVNCDRTIENIHPLQIAYYYKPLSYLPVYKLNLFLWWFLLFISVGMSLKNSEESQESPSFSQWPWEQQQAVSQFYKEKKRHLPGGRYYGYRLTKTDRAVSQSASQIHDFPQVLLHVNLAFLCPRLIQCSLWNVTHCIGVTVR